MNSKFHAAKPGFPSFVSKSGSVPLGRSGGMQVLPERRHLCASLESVNELLTPDGTSDDQHRTLAGPKQAHALNVLDDWRLVPFLQEWRLDGVVLGVDTEENLSQMLNVAIGGVCRQVVNIFGGQRAPLETLYIGLVAVLRGDSFVFEYVPFGENLLSSLVAQSDGLQASTGYEMAPYFDDRTHPLLRPEVGENGAGEPRTDLTKFERLVGAWKLGNVTDTASVRDPLAMRELPKTSAANRFMTVPTGEHNVSAKIVVEWMDWRSLIRLYPTVKLGRDHLLRSMLIICGIVYNFPHEDVYERPTDPDVLKYAGNAYADHTTRLVGTYDLEESYPCITEALKFEQPYLKCFYPTVAISRQSKIGKWNKYLSTPQVTRYVVLATRLLTSPFPEGGGDTFQDVIMRSIKIMESELFEVKAELRAEARQDLDVALKRYEKDMQSRPNDESKYSMNGPAEERTTPPAQFVDGFVRAWIAQDHQVIDIDREKRPVLYDAYEAAKDLLLPPARGNPKVLNAIANYVHDILDIRENLDADGKVKPDNVLNAISCAKDLAKVLNITELFMRAIEGIARSGPTPIPLHTIPESVQEDQIAESWRRVYRPIQPGLLDTVQEDQDDSRPMTSNDR